MLGGGLEALGVMLEHEAFEQGAGDGALVFGQFADRLEVVLQIVGNGPFVGIEHQREAWDQV